MKDGKRERAFLCRVVREAWEKCGGRPSVTDVKSAFDLVTDIDFAMEKFITRAIGEEFPGDAVIGEEYNPLTELPAGRCWTVDPVDGTVNFAHGLPLFGVQCAFCEGGIPPSQKAHCTPKSGSPCAKFTVPSTGSTVQHLPAGSSVRGLYSSPITASPGNSSPMARVMNFSMAKSMSVTRSNADLTSVTLGLPPHFSHASRTTLQRNARSRFPSFIISPFARSRGLCSRFARSTPISVFLPCRLCSRYLS